MACMCVDKSHVDQVLRSVAIATTSQNDVSLPYWKSFVSGVLGEGAVWGTQAGIYLTRR